MEKNHYRFRKLKDLPIEERPQERIEKFGVKALSDRELLAMLIRSGTKHRDVMELAEDIISRAGSLSGLLRWDPSDFQKIYGIGKIKSLQLAVQVEVSKRMMKDPCVPLSPIDEPSKVWKLLFTESKVETVEKVWVLCLNRKNRLIRVENITSGTATSSVVHPREVFRPAIRHGSSAVILAHNHPSGDPTPSASDLEVTQKISNASDHVGIDFLDHVIIGEVENCPKKIGYFSFSEEGLI